ncbi:MAG: hypothetical protein VKJ05_06740 [Synechococcaceae cyanobacterium]|nr:hypothetical protein [Synechococcaceae cyanobacterium]
MPPAPAIARTILSGPRRRLLALVAVLALVVGIQVAFPSVAFAAAERHFLCDGEPLGVELVSGAVDAVGIPNTLAGTLPGAYVVLRWQGVQLPLPRTNNAGAPSYSDGKWAWREDDPAQPRLRLRRPGGELQEFRCVPEL